MITFNISAKELRRKKDPLDFLYKNVFKKTKINRKTHSIDVTQVFVSGELYDILEEKCSGWEVLLYAPCLLKKAADFNVMVTDKAVVKRYS